MLGCVEFFVLQFSLVCFFLSSIFRGIFMVFFFLCNVCLDLCVFLSAFSFLLVYFVFFSVFVFCVSMFFFVSLAPPGCARELGMRVYTCVLFFVALWVLSHVPGITHKPLCHCRGHTGSSRNTFLPNPTPIPIPILIPIPTSIPTPIPIPNPLSAALSSWEHTA